MTTQQIPPGSGTAPQGQSTEIQDILELLRLGRITRGAARSALLDAGVAAPDAMVAQALRGTLMGAELLGNIDSGVDLSGGGGRLPPEPLPRLHGTLGGWTPPASMFATPQRSVRPGAGQDEGYRVPSHPTYNYGLPQISGSEDTIPPSGAIGAQQHSTVDQYGEPEFGAGRGIGGISDTVPGDLFGAGSKDGGDPGGYDGGLPGPGLAGPDLTIGNLPPPPVSREDELTRQEFIPSDVFQRYLLERPGFRETSPFVRGGLKSRYNDVYEQYRLASAFDPDLSFADYLRGPRLDAGGLRDMLSRVQQVLSNFRTGVNLGGEIGVLGEGVGRSEGELQALGRYASEDEEIPGRAAFLASLAPTLLTAAPAARAPFVRGANMVFDRFRSQFPGRSFLDYAQQRGFF